MPREEGWEAKVGASWHALPSDGDILPPLGVRFASRAPFAQALAGEPIPVAVEPRELAALQVEARLRAAPHLGAGALRAAGEAGRLCLWRDAGGGKPPASRGRVAPLPGRDAIRFWQRPQPVARRARLGFETEQRTRSCAKRR